MSYIIYGLVNCNTTKKARTWFETNGIPYTFHNNKTQPISEEKIKDWCKQVGWEKLLNKKGTAFKGLHWAVQKNATTLQTAVDIMTLRPSTIKRPLIEKEGKVLSLGYDERKYEILYL
jgi:Spx/MgsR family transcriptional regulator